MILKIIWIDVFLRKKRKSNKKKSNVNIIDRGGTVKNVQRKNIYIFFFLFNCHVPCFLYNLYYDLYISRRRAFS